MSSAPDNGSTPTPSGSKKSGAPRQLTEKEEQTARKYSRLSGWLLVAIIVAYIGLQVPLPYKLITVVAGVAGFAGGIVLLVQSLRLKLSPLMLISAVVVIISSAMFAGTASAQALFWNATIEFDECRTTALTERSNQQCLTDYQDNMFSSIPGQGN